MRPGSIQNQSIINANIDQVIEKLSPLIQLRDYAYSRGLLIIRGQYLENSDANLLSDTVLQAGYQSRINEGSNNYFTMTINGLDSVGIPHKKDRYSTHILLFLATLLTTCSAGVMWQGKNPWADPANLLIGIPFSLSLLTILTMHEFGHYFAAKYHKVKTTLPYYIPAPFSIGTFGAVIRIKSRMQNRIQLLDIGAAGPLAGFIPSVLISIYGLMYMPGPEFILECHGGNPIDAQPGDPNYLEFGSSILFDFLINNFARHEVLLSEVYHYPYIFAGWIGLFITSLNLLPIGQLDGGHIAYAMFGPRSHKKIAIVAFILIITLGFLYRSLNWFIWGALILFIIRLKHPPVPDPRELNPARQIVGAVNFIIFILCFIPAPFKFSLNIF